MNAVFDSRANVRAAAAYDRAENPVEFDTKTVEISTMRKRTPAAAPDVELQPAVKVQKTPVAPRSARLRGWKADDTLDSPWYERVSFTVPITLPELRAWLAVMWMCALDRAPSVEAMWDSSRLTAYNFATAFFRAIGLRKFTAASGSPTNTFA